MISGMGLPGDLDLAMAMPCEDRDLLSEVNQEFSCLRIPRANSEESARAPLELSEGLGVLAVTGDGNSMEFA